MAQYGWGLMPETEFRARHELNEVPEQRQMRLDAVREQIITRPDIAFLRTDDAFLIRFLRAREFDIFSAFRLYSRYFEFRQNHDSLFQQFEASEPAVKSSLLDGFPGVLTDRDHCGRPVLVMFASNWDARRYRLADIFRALLLSLEKLIEEEETQVNGFVIIVDWSQFTFRQSTWITPTELKLMVECLQDCFPARFAGIHFVNQPWYVEAVFKVIKPFIKDNIKQKFHMHGINLTLLHAYVHPDILPAELGGSGPPYSLTSWADQLIGDESFSYGEKHIYWPEHCTGIKTRSETFPIDHYTTEVSNDTIRHSTCGANTSQVVGTQLDSGLFLRD